MNIIMDDSLIFYDEDESSNHTLVNQPRLTSRSALWFLQTGNKIFKRMDHYASKTMRTILHDETDLDHMDAFLIQVGTIYEPNSFGLEQLFRRIPYSNPEYLERKLTSAAERGWLEKVGERNYFVSGRGRSLRKKLLSASMTVYAQIAVLTVDELERIDDLLGSVVDAAILGKNPEEKIALSWSRRFGLHDADFPLAHVRRRVVDLLAFRDDSHLAAWRPHEQFGYLWETFTYVWNNEANTPSNLAARLSYRGFG